ncbi:28S ribosomal protein S5, mitochondrial [Cladophialophora chaetospira]|uniref:Small ribosomal subunit protein uS5m n=1 Tax=Cladophialophora chaetospira TaxID=386627 RepID=A0AA39CC22_9EURO|nr:28S ribosomal protein S5, mitochondrial [Cladophialophora chaetospira]
MSVARSSECVFCLFTRSSRPKSLPRRQFHTSPVHQKRKPKFPSVKAEASQLDLNERAKEFPSVQDAPDHYSPEQRAAIEAAQKLIDVDKLQKQTGMRTDPWKLKYYDELTKIDPVVDNPVRAPMTNIDDNARLKTDEELEADFIKLMNEIPDPKHENDYDQELWDKFDKNLRLTVGREEAERNPPTALAPDLPRVAEPKPQQRKTSKDGEDSGRDQRVVSPAMLQLMQMTGYSQKEIARLRVKTVIQHRVVNQTRLGKIQKMYCLSVAGNGQGLIGVGEGKSAEGSQALLQSQYRAIRNMTPILRYEDRTIYGDLNAKVSATELELYARPPGFGLRCQQYIWEICRCAGISDLAARVTRSRNPMNTVKATVQALLSQKHPEDIARARGKKMVDVRKVYYAGQT